MLRYTGEAWQPELPGMETESTGDVNELIIFSPWLARCTYRGQFWHQTGPNLTGSGLDREQALAKMKEYARLYAEQGWRVTWIWKEAQNEVHEGAEDSGVTS